MTAGRGRRTEDGRRMTGGRGQRTEDGGQRTEDGGQVLRDWNVWCAKRITREKKKA